MTTGELEPLEVRRFSPIQAAIGVIVRPASAMREIAATRPWLIALGFAILLSILNSLANLTAPMPGFPGDGELPPDMPAGLQALLAITTSPWLAVAGALFFTPIFLTLWTGILMLVARIFRGQGSFSAVLSTQAFASTPSLLLAPVIALLNLGGAAVALTLLKYVIGLTFSIWTLVLQVIGIRESLALSTGQAVAVLIIPIGILIMLGCGLIIVVTGLAVFGLRQLGA